MDQFRKSTETSVKLIFEKEIEIGKKAKKQG